MGFDTPGGVVTALSRLGSLSDAEMSESQRRIRDALVAGPRGAVVGPFQVWLRRPGLADVADRFGKYCRFGSEIDRQVSELAIMQVAAHTGAAFEWDHHYPYAIEAGLTEAQLEALLERRTPQDLSEKSSMAYATIHEMLNTNRLTDESYHVAVSGLGENLLIDLVGVVGYYLFVSLTINAFNVR